jgi:hypothetical protein
MMCKSLQVDGERLHIWLKGLSDRDSAVEAGISQPGWTYWRAKHHLSANRRSTPKERWTHG